MSFRRLYGDLVRGREKDASYQLEREELMYKIGVDVGRTFNTTKIVPPKFHGKLARIRDSGHDLKMINERDNQFKRSNVFKKSLSDMKTESDSIIKISQEINVLINAKKQIPASLIKKLPGNKVTTCAESSERTGTSPLSSSSSCAAARVTGRRGKPLSSSGGGMLLTKSTGRLTSHIELPAIAQQREKRRAAQISRRCVNADLNPHTLVGGKNIANKSYSLSKWTTEERQRLTEIFHSMKQPEQRKSLELWRLYFEAFAAQFKLFFPKRTIDEIIAKAREMTSKRQMKELGEERYWLDQKHV